FGARRRQELLERPVQLGTEPREPFALRLALGGETLRVRLDARSGVGDELLLTLCKLGEALLRRVCRAIEILLPVGEPLRHLRLRLGERVRQRGDELALAVAERDPPLLGDAPLFFGEQRDRIGARARRRPLQPRRSPDRL